MNALTLEEQAALRQPLVFDRRIDFVAEDDSFDADEAAEAIPLAWLECMGDASKATADAPVDLGWIAPSNSHLGDEFCAQILDCADSNWLLVLALTRPHWAEMAMRRLAELCKAQPTWARWVEALEQDHVAKLDKDKQDAADERAASELDA